MMMEYDRSKDPMLAMDYARSSTPNYGDLHREIEQLRKELDEWRTACEQKHELLQPTKDAMQEYQRQVLGLQRDLTRYRAVMEQAVEAFTLLTERADKHLRWDRRFDDALDATDNALTALREALNTKGEIQ